MPRKQTPAPTALAPDLKATPDKASLSDQAIALAHQEQQQQLIAQATFGVEPIEYSLAAFAELARSAHQMSGVLLVKLGSILLAIQHADTPENFKWALEYAHVSERYAYKAMHIAKRIGDDLNKRQLVATLGATKALELMNELDDTELASLSVDKERIDEIDSMTTRELRAAVRKAKQEREEDLDKHKEQLNRERGKNRQWMGDAEERATVLISDVRSLASNAIGQLRRITKALETYGAVCKENREKQPDDLADQLEAVFAEVTEALDAASQAL